MRKLIENPTYSSANHYAFEHGDRGTTEMATFTLKEHTGVQGKGIDLPVSVSGKIYSMTPFVIDKSFFSF